LVGIVMIVNICQSCWIVPIINTIGIVASQ
jgi:hypothetical protein